MRQLESYISGNQWKPRRSNGFWVIGRVSSGLCNSYLWQFVPTPFLAATPWCFNSRNLASFQPIGFFLCLSATAVTFFHLLSSSTWFCKHVSQGLHEAMFCLRASRPWFQFQKSSLPYTKRFHDLSLNQGDSGTCWKVRMVPDSKAFYNL